LAVVFSGFFAAQLVAQYLYLEAKHAPLVNYKLLAAIVRSAQLCTAVPCLVHGWSARALTRTYFRGLRLIDDPDAHVRRVVMERRPVLVVHLGVAHLDAIRAGLGASVCVRVPGTRFDSYLLIPDAAAFAVQPCVPVGSI
jgi:hypothetical protein